MKIKSIVLVTLALFLSANVEASSIDFEWTWAGANGYTASGTMSYADTLDNTGIITASDISTFTITALKGSNPLFTWDLATGTQHDPFQLSFDTTTDELVFGGYFPTALDSVVWGNDSSATGTGGEALLCGNSVCVLTIDGINYATTSVTDKTQFTFTRVSTVPVPAAAWLFSSGLIGLIGVARRKVRS